MSIRCFTFFRIHKYSIHFVLYLYWIYYIVSILYYTFIEFIILLYDCLVIPFARCKEYIFWQVSFSKFSDILLAFPCAIVIGNLWGIFKGLILSVFFYEMMHVSPLISLRKKSYKGLITFQYCIKHFFAH